MLETAGRFMWNKYHPEDPVQKTDRIIYADGNPQNLDRDNLIKLSGAEYATYTHLRGALIEKGTPIRMLCKLLSRLQRSGVG
jgi:hypothetical protein